jgi:hypothetical protein
MSNWFEITKFKDLYELANKLCNTVDGAIQSASTEMAGYAAHGAFNHIGKLQEGFEHLSRARQCFNEASELDKVNHIKLGEHHVN